MVNIIEGIHKYRPLTEKELASPQRVVIVASLEEDCLERYGFEVGDEVYAQGDYLTGIHIKRNLEDRNSTYINPFEIGLWI